MASTPLKPENNLLRFQLPELEMLGATEDSRAWCLKALHPAEPSISGVAVPDGTTTETVRIEFNFSKTFSAPPILATPTWGFNGSLIPHMIQPWEHTCTDSAGIEVGPPTVIYNTLYDATGQGLEKVTGSWLNTYERWRLAAQSVTIHLDADAMHNTGTVVVNQVPVQPTIVWPSGANGITHGPALYYSDLDRPQYKRIMAINKAYQNNLMFGAYVPLKLTNTSQHWRSTKELTSCFTPSAFGTITAGTVTVPTTTNPGYPFWELSPLKYDIGTSTTLGGLTMAPCNDVFAHICATGISPQASLVLKFKLCYECQVNASSPQSPFTQPAPESDEYALQVYSRMVRKLPDAYPADYNSDGKVLKWIADGLKSVAPILASIPGYGAPLSLAATAAGTLAGYGSNSLARFGKKGRRKQKKNKKNNRSASAPNAQATPAAKKRGRQPAKPTPSKQKQS